MASAARPRKKSASEEDDERERKKERNVRRDSGSLRPSRTQAEIDTHADRLTQVRPRHASSSSQCSTVSGVAHQAAASFGGKGGRSQLQN